METLNNNITMSHLIAVIMGADIDYSIADVYLKDFNQDEKDDFLLTDSKEAETLIEIQLENVDESYLDAFRGNKQFVIARVQKEIKAREAKEKSYE